MEARMTDDPVEIAWTVELLFEEVVAPPARNLFRASVPVFMTHSPPFRFFIALDRSAPATDEVAAAGLATMMAAPWIEEKVLAVDGLWLRAETHRPLAAVNRSSSRAGPDQ